MTPQKTARTFAQEEEMRRRGFLTVPECARRLHRSPNTVYRAIRAGKLEAIEVGGQKYVEFESFAEFAGPLAGDHPNSEEGEGE